MVFIAKSVLSVMHTSDDAWVVKAMIIIFHLSRLSCRPLIAGLST